MRILSSKAHAGASRREGLALAGADGRRQPKPSRAWGDSPWGEGGHVNHLVVVAAGTGGHVMPGIAVAEALRGRGWSVSWLGTQSGMERGLVERHGIAFDAIDFTVFAAKD